MTIIDIYRYKQIPPTSLPSFLVGVHALDYARATYGGWDFWGKLRDSVRDVSVAAALKSSVLQEPRSEVDARDKLK